MAGKWQFSISTLLAATFCVATGITATRLIWMLNNYESVRFAWPILGACIGAGIAAFNGRFVRGALIGIGVAIVLAVILPPWYSVRE